MALSSPDAREWTPIRVSWHDGAATVDWCHTAGVTFDDPFFGETVERCLRHPFRLLFRHETDLDELVRLAAAHPGLRPAGFVFHMSRCGSTLVTRMLQAAGEHLVLSEPPPLDAVLRSHHDDATVDDARRVRWLVAMLAALAQPRTPEQRSVVVKFDAWAAMELPLVRRAFPRVPWIFVFRDPVEVLASHAGRPGAHAIPGALPPELFGLRADQIGEVDFVDYAAQVLGRICGAALEHRDDPLATFVDYDRLPGFVSETLAPRWSSAVDAASMARMDAAAAVDAKNPSIPFADDRRRKQERATPAVRAAAARWLEGPYRELIEASDGHRR